MLDLHCPECGSRDVDTVSLGEKPTPFALVAIAKDGKPHGSIHVNLIRCSNCGFMWLKFPKYQLEDLKIDHD